VQITEKGKPVERQGRKAMGLLMSTDIYDRQAAKEIHHITFNFEFSLAIMPGYFYWIMDFYNGKQL
jgi:hypothetical protein